MSFSHLRREGEGIAMSIRNLDAVFKPRSLVFVGAVSEPRSVGGIVLENLRGGGFRGVISVVGPQDREIASLPEMPDLAVIAAPSASVPGIVAALGRKGTRGAVVIGTGSGEPGAGGRTLQQRILEAAKPYLLRLVGPNCLGLMVPGAGLNASFAHLQPARGGVAFVSQSGTIVTAMLDWAEPRGIGFSHVVSMGDMADVDFGDMLDYLGDDTATRAILLYVERLTAARKFMSAARAAARRKPVLVVKIGRHAEAARAALPRTGALGSSDKIHDAAFRRAGMLRVGDMAELFDALETLSATGPQRGERLAILTNGGGPGLLATDALLEKGGTLAALAPQSIARLDAALPPSWSRGNPVDLEDDADAERYKRALEILLDDPGVDAVLAINCPTAMEPSVEAARAVVWTVRQGGARLFGRNLLATWLGEHTAAAARRIFSEAQIASYETPDRAIRGFMHGVHYRRNQELLRETPPSRAEGMEPDAESASRVLRVALAEGREWLDPRETAAVLEAYGVPLIETRLVGDAAAAAAAAREIGRPVALKIRSRDIRYKSDIGGVALNLNAPERVEREALAMQQRIGKAQPQARIEGFVLQEMVRRPGAIELIVGVVDDALFGPVILFGQGGTAAEVLDDTTLELPPLNLALSRAQIARTRVSKLLQGYRNTPAADLDAVAEVLVRVSQMVADLPELAELDVDPLLADAGGVIALDARLRVRAAALPGTRRLAIRPYPKELESEATLRDGTALRLRPIRPEDEPALLEFVSHMAPEDARFRFFTPMKGMSHELAARLTQIDYDREVAIVAEPAGSREIWGVVRYAADPDHRSAEYAVTVRSDLKGRGLGSLLMRRMLDVAKARGISEIFGCVLRENAPMLGLCRALGFSVAAYPEDPDIVRVVREL